MFRILLAADGSENSIRAVDYLVQFLRGYKEAPEVHLVNAQPSLPGNVTMFVGSKEVKQYHDEEGSKALAPARAKLDAAGISYIAHIGVGEPSHVITAYAKEKNCKQIVMGTRGLGSLGGMFLGSVTTKVVHLSEVPVLLVK